MTADVDGFKKHIQFEEGMDDSMFSLYVESAKKYVKNGTDKESENLIYMIAGMFNTYKVPEEEMGKALNAMTPLFLQEANVKDAEIIDE